MLAFKLNSNFFSASGHLWWMRMRVKLKREEDVGEEEEGIRYLSSYQKRKKDQKDEKWREPSEFDFGESSVVDFGINLDFMI